jgi:hypothetical protein
VPPLVRSVRVLVLQEPRTVRTQALQGPGLRFWDGGDRCRRTGGLHGGPGLGVEVADDLDGGERPDGSSDQEHEDVVLDGGLQTVGRADGEDD